MTSKYVELPVPEKSIKLALYHDKVKISEAVVGIDPESRDDFDEKDYFAPPADFNSVSLTIINNDLWTICKQLMIEVRPGIEKGQIFNLKMKTLTDLKLELAVEGIKNFEGDEVYLLDTRLSRFYNLREQKSLMIVPLHEYTDYKLLIGNKEFINEIMREYLPTEYILYQNYPNPFNPRSIIRFSIPNQDRVTLSVYNILGQLVSTLIDDEVFDVGYYEISFDGGRLASGVYVYSITAGEFTSSRKMVLVK